MKIEFDEIELKALSDLNLPFDVTKDLTDDEYFALNEAVTDALMDHLDKNYNPTPKGKVYYSIIDILSKCE